MIKEVNLFELKDFNIEENKNPFTKYIAYFSDSDILGYIQYNLIYDTIDIVMVYVRENERNNKIGTKLLNYLIENNKNVKNITLEVNCLNEIAIKLYKKLGFKVVAVRKGYYDGVDGYLMNYDVK